MPRRIVAGLVLLGAAAVAAYRVPLRRWYLTWGATPDEVTGAIPGDDLLPEPDMLSTRAVTVGAPASAIRPWLVQMGSGRGGAYTYDWIENLLGLNMHSVDEVLPQYQSLQVGDVLPGGPTGPFMRCAVLETDRALVWRSDDGRWIWSFLLRPDGPGTRLISRNRIADPGASPLRRLVDRVVMEPGSLVMERKMLLGIKQRAERLAAARSGRPKPATVHHADRTADRGVPAEGQRRLRGDGRFPMDRLTSVHGALVGDVLSAGIAIQTVHRGPYDQLTVTYMELNRMQRGSDVIVLLIGVPLLIARRCGTVAAPRAPVCCCSARTGSSCTSTAAPHWVRSLTTGCFQFTSRSSPRPCSRLPRWRRSSTRPRCRTDRVGTPYRTLGAFMIVSGVVTLVVWGILAVSAVFSGGGTEKLDSYATNVT